MGLVVVGINHRSAPLKMRERISCTKKQRKTVLFELKDTSAVTGAAILSTCNRMELYAYLDGHNTKERIIRFILDKYELSWLAFNHYFYVLEGKDATRHLFRVACGLDSQVLGETQILGQVKEAWRAAKDLEMLSGILEALFEKAVYIGRQVRLKTKISQGNVSMGSVALRMLQRKFPDLLNRSILIIGAGKVAALVSKYLKEKGIRGIFVSNRTYSKAKELALSCKGEAINFSELKEKLKIVDIIITSTSSPHLIIRKETLREVMQARVKPLFVMDLALPRDIDPGVRDIPNVSLYDLDDLKSVVEENFIRRKQEAILAEMIVMRELNKFLNGNGKILCERETLAFLKIV